MVADRSKSRRARDEEKRKVCRGKDAPSAGADGRMDATDLLRPQIVVLLAPTISLSPLVTNAVYTASVTCWCC